MKIRQGFVSNSSTTSFFIYGVEFETQEDAIKALKKNGYPEKKLEAIQEDGLEGVLDTNDLELYVDYEDAEQVFIGLSPKNIKDDETGKEFKERAVKQIEDIFGEKAVSKLTPEWIQREICS